MAVNPPLVLTAPFPIGTPPARSGIYLITAVNRGTGTSSSAFRRYSAKSGVWYVGQRVDPTVVTLVMSEQYRNAMRIARNSTTVYEGEWNSRKYTVSWQGVVREYKSVLERMLVRHQLEAAADVSKGA